jgi:hypothetical protein
MIAFHRPALRLAQRLYDRLNRDRTSERQVLFPYADWNRCRTLERLLTKARQAGWHAAARQVTDDLVSALVSLDSRLIALRRQVGSSAPAGFRPSLRLLYDELVSLFDDFESVRYEPAREVLAVTTDTIELEGLTLGAFEIRLDLHQLTGSYRYRVVAIDPQPASTNSRVTHPHVLDGSLCEGDGQQAIHRALEQGRLSDFFHIVDNILNTYNPESAYVQIENWTGVRCAACDDYVSVDDTFLCEACRGEVCDSCSSSCERCGRTHCTGCLRQCPRCEIGHCRRCLTSCAVCGEESCPSCLIQDRCEECHVPDDLQIATDFALIDQETGAAAVEAGPLVPAATTGPADVAVQSDRLVETFVPA